MTAYTGLELLPTCQRGSRETGRQVNKWETSGWGFPGRVSIPLGPGVRVMEKAQSQGQEQV